MQQAICAGWVCCNRHIANCSTSGPGSNLNLRKQLLQPLGAAGIRYLLGQLAGWTIERFKY